MSVISPEIKSCIDSYRKMVFGEVFTHFKHVQGVHFKLVSSTHSLKSCPMFQAMNIRPGLVRIQWALYSRSYTMTFNLKKGITHLNIRYDGNVCGLFKAEPRDHTDKMWDMGNWARSKFVVTKHREFTVKPPPEVSLYDIRVFRGVPRPPQDFQFVCGPDGVWQMITPNTKANLTFLYIAGNLVAVDLQKNVVTPIHYLFTADASSEGMRPFQDKMQLAYLDTDWNIPVMEIYERLFMDEFKMIPMFSGMNEPHDRIIVL